MRKKIFAILLSFVIAFLCGCGSYTETDIEEARRQAYDDGYDAGYDDGYDRGVENQKEASYDDFLIDGRSIRSVQNQVYEEFGMTPDEAFAIVDIYESESDHGGFKKSEYKKAIEAIYYTASIFPQDY